VYTINQDDKDVKSMKYSRLLTVLCLLSLTVAMAAGCSVFKNPWEGTWWGVQDAGMNWSGDNIQYLESFTFTKDGDQITVKHQVQRGRQESTGDLTGTGKADGGTLTITPANGGKPVSFTYDRLKSTIETSLTNADKSPVILKQLTDDNKSEMEKTREHIISVSQKPENAVNTTISSSKTAVRSKSY
jgi:hypothetical protein